jgi:predicted transcriptional regulator
MANQPAPETVTVSFTLPRELAKTVDRHAKQNLTTKSDIIRRALLAYIPPAEAEAIMSAIMNDAPDGEVVPSQGQVQYPKGKTRRKGE